MTVFNHDVFNSVNKLIIYSKLIPKYQQQKKVFKSNIGLEIPMMLRE